MLCFFSSVIYQVCRGVRWGGDNSGSRQQLPASWLGVLTPHMTSMGTEQPLLLAGCGNKGTDLNFPLLALLLLDRRALGAGPGQSQT